VATDFRASLPGLVLGIFAAIAVIYFVNKFRKGSNSSSSSSSTVTITSPTSPDVTVEQKLPPKQFLTREKQQVPLIEKINISHDTRLLRFGLPQGHSLGLPIGKHIKITCPNPSDSERKEPNKWNGRDDTEAHLKEVTRSYTPTSSEDDIGYFDLIVKIYEGGVKPAFPDGGKMSKYLDRINIGDVITIQGPWGLIEYKTDGEFEYAKKKLNGQKIKIGMIAGGTGITPMLQLVRAILEKEQDSPIKVSLIFANQTEADILVRDRLEDLERRFPDRFHLWYTLDNVPEGSSWKYSKGFINKDMIEQHLPKPAEDSLVLICGPPPMVKFACEPNLEALGYGKGDYLVF